MLAASTLRLVPCFTRHLWAVISQSPPELGWSWDLNTGPHDKPRMLLKKNITVESPREVFV